MLRMAEFSHAQGHTSALVSAGCLISKEVLAQKQCRRAKRQLMAVQLFRDCIFEYEWLPSSHGDKSNIPEPIQKRFSIQLMKKSVFFEEFEVLSTGGRERDTCWSVSCITNAQKMLSRHIIILEPIFASFYPQSSLSKVHTD